MLEFHPEFLSEAASSDLYVRLLADSNWQTEEFRIFGKNTLAPRQTAWFGDVGTNYRYTAIDHVANGWPDILGELRTKVNAALKDAANFVMLNHYRTGADHMGWHRDNEKAAAPIIASVSLGGTRRFRIQPEHTTEVAAFDLTAGSLLIFDGRLRHQLARTQRPCSPRINLTFRSICQ